MSARKGPGQAWWESHLGAIAREGIGTKAYAQREGLPVSSLYYWRRRLKAQGPAVQPPTQNPPPALRQRLFVPVAMGDCEDAGHGAGDYVLTLGNGLRLELPGLPSPQWLARVSQAFSGQAT